MRLTLAILILLTAQGCAVKTWSGTVYECPTGLIERVETKLTECQGWPKKAPAELPSAP